MIEHDLLTTVKALTDVTRLRILGRLADRPWAAGELAAAVGLRPAEAFRHLEHLVATGLAARSASTGGPAGGATYALRHDAIQALGRRLGALEATRPAPAELLGPDGTPLPAEDARVLHAFLEDDRLVSIPAQVKKRQVVLRYLRDRCFTEDRAYPEQEVNQRLALFHPDVASLRREMVDTGLMTRAAGEYRRPS